MKVKPQLINISHNSDTKRLYDLEHARNQIIQDCAKEWRKVMHKRLKFLPDEDIWIRAIPQVLFDILEGFEQPSSQLAAKAYLEQYGYIVVEPGEQDEINRIT